MYDYFDGFVFGDMVSHSKPDPEIYEKACEAIGVLPQESVAFEDAPAGNSFSGGSGTSSCSGFQTLCSRQKSWKR